MPLDVLDSNKLQGGDMRHKSIATLCMAVLAGTLSMVAQAHHSLSGQFDVSKSFEITGVVSRVEWVNPHTQVFVDVKQADGSMLTYKFESLPVAMMRKA